ncbi:iron ABC transporter permease [Bowdeniella nasicola]|uniref:Iron ABC transporter permease n=1 Tax=Bowdeniella nasicola TaxID=208480 RepID=A0A1Q5Q4T3_9ACTO|nr:iron ABC transporter permease [Bowdeniella nasicola]OKL54838.1 iron ABC transporter permease [Bowdeniella nasicola]
MSTRSSIRRTSLVAIMLGGAYAIAVVLALGIGAVTVPPADVVRDLLSGDGLIWSFRMPRVLVGTLAGAGMAISGCLLQVSLRNPLAAPDTIGITAGGGLAAVAALLGVGVLPAQALTPIAFVGALLGAGLVLLVAGRGITDPIRLALTGVAVSVGLAALTHLLLVRAAPEAGAAMTWLKGSLYARTLSDAAVAGPTLAATLLAVLLASRHLDALNLDDPLTAGVGVRATRWRIFAVVLAAISGAAAVGAAGVLGFAGLIIPHLSRLLVGRVMIRHLPIAALAGATLVVACDALGRWAFAPTEIPVGALIAIVGAPYFVFLLIRMTSLGERP